MNDGRSCFWSGTVEDTGDLAEVVSPQQKLGRNELREDEIQGVEKVSVAQAFQLSRDRMRKVKVQALTGQRCGTEGG